MVKQMTMSENDNKNCFNSTVQSQIFYKFTKVYKSPTKKP